MLTQDFAAYAAKNNANASKHVASDNSAIMEELQKRTTRTGRTLPIGSTVEFPSDLMDHLDIYLREDPILDKNGVAKVNSNGEPIKVLHVACLYNGAPAFVQFAKFVGVSKCLTSDAYAVELIGKPEKYRTQTAVLAAQTVYDQLALLEGKKVKSTFAFIGKVYDFTREVEVERTFTLYEDIE